MKIYTKTGDQGQTGLWGGARLSKSHARVAAYGDIDELNSFLGAALAHLQGPAATSLALPLARIQEELFIIGALLASPADKRKELTAPFDKGLPAEAAARLEGEIDALTKDLKPMTKFILPGGSPAGAWFHLARTVCRRAERAAVGLAASEELPENILAYLNRLSDYLFTAARWINAQSGRPETQWQGLTKRP